MVNDPERDGDKRLSLSEYLSYINRYIVVNDPTYTSLIGVLKVIAKNTHLSKEWESENFPTKILIICDQNQGRSQIEAAIVNLLVSELGLPLSVISAGVFATPEKYDGKPNPQVVNKLTALGISMEMAQVNQLSEDDVDANTLVIALNDPSILPEYVYKAKVVISTFMADHFPGSKLPKKADKLLDELVDETTYLGINIVLKLAEAFELSNFEIFIDYFKKRIINPEVET